MATLGDLKNRIIAETLRDDLADDMAAMLTMTIQKSIDQYASMRWWFNERFAIVPVLQGDPLAPLPADFRFADAVFLRVGGVSYAMTARQPVEIDALYTAGNIQGQSTDYAVLEGSFYLWPVPINSTWPIELRYVADVSPALDYEDDASSNFWTNQGQDLITARAKLRLYRDFLSAQLQDPRVINANNQEEEAYSRLRQEHNRRMTTTTIRAGF